MLASLLKEKNILILDNNRKIGSKILVSGGGKCNLTNGKVKPKNYLGNQRFVRNVLKRFNQDAVLEWFVSRGLQLLVRKRQQYFCEHSAKDVVDILGKEISPHAFHLETNVLGVHKNERDFEIQTDKGIFLAQKVVVASGGLSFPKIGATSIGYDVAKSFGHQVTPLSAGLVGLTVQPEQAFFKTLSGISTEVKISIEDKEIDGALLFTHKGISGPAVLDASLYWKKGKIVIDFLPNLNFNMIKLLNKKLSNILGLSNRLAKALLVELEIEDKPCQKLNSQEWKKLESLKAYSFAPAGTFGYSKAEVTQGGVLTDEVDASSMMSKKVENLYFLGEVLDVTGELGGYNFQWAFSTAYVCSKGIE
jgi:hypothetical protein